jgi:hypothetical protein
LTGRPVLPGEPDGTATMTEPESHTLGLLRRMDGKIDALAERLDKVEVRLVDEVGQVRRDMATKELLASVLHVLELKIERAALGATDEVSTLRRRVEALETRVRRLEEPVPG